MTTQHPSTLHIGSVALQVLAHPLRSRLLAALRIGGPATATELARTLETNTGATSYHLRKLASVGLVEEVDGGRGRQRPWQAATQSHEWTESDVANDPDGQAATDWLRRNYFRFFVDRYENWLAVQGSWPLDWQDAAGASDFALRLSPVRLAAFNEDVQALIERYRRDAPPAPVATDPAAASAAAAEADDDEPVVQIYLYAFPLEARPR